jgi:MFS family permease
VSVLFHLLALIDTQISFIQKSGLLGLALAPTVGGITAHYWSWRAIHYLLAAFTLAALLCIFFFFPETSHPGTRGIDEYKQTSRICSKWMPVTLNPFSDLVVFQNLNILSVVGWYFTSWEEWI